MRITRRSFLDLSGSAAALLTAPGLSARKLHLASNCQPACAILDLGPQCLLAESLLGYRRAIPKAKTVFAGEFQKTSAELSVIILPAAGIIDPEIAQRLQDGLAAGGTILLESGGGFLNPAEFSSQQQMLKDRFGIAAEKPVDLWAAKENGGPGLRAAPTSRRGAAGKGIPPYVDYDWPHETIVRDFSLVVPLSAQNGIVFGKIDRIPVALRRRVGRGVLIVLGSPLGPHLHSGDPEACRLVRALLAHG